MKVLAIVKETTVFMTVETEPGIRVEFLRNPFGEWQQPIPGHEGCYVRTSSKLANVLEELWMYKE